MEEKIAKATIKQVLLDVNPLVRKYHKNIIGFRTGEDPTNANELDLEDSIHFLKHVWGMCLEWGNQRINYIGYSVKQLADFLNSFKSKKEIHDARSILTSLIKD